MFLVGVFFIIIVSNIHSFVLVSFFRLLFLIFLVSYWCVVMIIITIISSFCWCIFLVIFTINPIFFVGVFLTILFLIFLSFCWCIFIIIISIISCFLLCTYLELFLFIRYGLRDNDKQKSQKYHHQV